VRVEELERSTRAREAKLSSEMELARSRQRELRERTDEVVRSLEEEIRRAREAATLE
jgi:ribosome-binding protein aMBF1 (putative translation factor)